MKLVSPPTHGILFLSFMRFLKKFGQNQSFMRFLKKLAKPEVGVLFWEIMDPPLLIHVNKW